MNKKLIIILIVMFLPTFSLAKEGGEKMSKEEKVFQYLSRFHVLDHDGSTYAERIDIMTKVIELEPDKATHYYNRGVIYAYSDEYDKAFADYSKALELNPNHTGALGNRAVIFSDRGEYDNAVSDCERSVAVDPHSFAAFNLPNFIFERGKQRMKEKQYDAAIKSFTQVIDYPENPLFRSTNAYIHRAECYLAKNDINKCKEDIQKAEKILKDAEPHDWKNDPLEGIDRLKKMLKE